MRISVACICLALCFTSPQLALAGKKKGGGGGGGHGGGARGTHMSGGHAGRSHTGGGARHSMRSNSHGSHTQHPVSSQHGAKGQHGLNAKRGSAHHGLNAHGRGGLKGHNRTNALARRGSAHRFAARNRFGNRWRGGAHWRSYHAVYGGYHRVWHDHFWWRAHYNSVLVGGGYWGSWYWNGGYWFPAWGYDPAFVYAYEQPIYAYWNLPPDQVVVNVQEALQDQGYYTGQIDGQMGSQTRDALVSYQRDHDLEQTAAIDEPTVASLGLVNEQS
jgi:hypothetical protein